MDYKRVKDYIITTRAALKSILNGGVGKNMLLATCSSMLVTFTSQVIIFPMLAKKTDAQSFGVILTAMGVVSVIISTFGNSLNNTRLIENNKYRKGRIEGDFLAILIIIATIAAFTAFFIVRNLDWGGTPQSVAVLLTVYSVLGVFRTYGMVFYRINLDYVRDFFLNLLVCGVQITICLIIKEWSLWPMVFICGEIMGLYILHNTSIYTESFIITPFFGETLKKETQLLIITLLLSATSYIDRFILYPFIGGEAVSAYNTSSLIGKCILLLYVPISGVCLSYFSKDKLYASPKRLSWITVSVILFSGVYYIFGLCFGPAMIKLMYPDLLELSIPYFSISTLATIIYATGNFFQTIIVSIIPQKYQIIILTGYITTHIIVGGILAHRYLIFGYGIAACITATIRLVVLLIILHKGIEK